MKAVVCILIVVCCFHPMKAGNQYPTIYPEASQSFSDDLAREIRKHKACSSIRVTASKGAADYVAHTGVWVWSYTVSRSSGEIVATGKTNRMSTMAREICEAVRKDAANVEPVPKK